MHQVRSPSVLAFHAWYETRNHLWVITELCAGRLDAIVAADAPLTPEAVQVSAPRASQRLRPPRGAVGARLRARALRLLGPFGLPCVRARRADAASARVIDLFCWCFPSPVQVFASDILTGLAALHGAGLCLGSLRARGVLVDEEGAARLASFTHARRFPEPASGRTAFARAHDDDLTALACAAPELLLPAGEGVHSMASDLWAVGCLLLELATGAPAFGRVDDPHALSPAERRAAAASTASRILFEPASASGAFRRAGTGSRPPPRRSAASMDPSMGRASQGGADGLSPSAGGHSPARPDSVTSHRAAERAATAAACGRAGEDGDGATSGRGATASGVEAAVSASPAGFSRAGTTAARLEAARADGPPAHSVASVADTALAPHLRGRTASAVSTSTAAAPASATDVLDLIGGLLAKHPSHRLAWADIAAHPVWTLAPPPTLPKAFPAEPLFEAFLERFPAPRRRPALGSGPLPLAPPPSRAARRHASAAAPFGVSLAPADAGRCWSTPSVTLPSPAGAARRSPALPGPSPLAAAPGAVAPAFPSPATATRAGAMRLPHHRPDGADRGQSPAGAAGAGNAHAAQPDALNRGAAAPGGSGARAARAAGARDSPTEWRQPSTATDRAEAWQGAPSCDAARRPASRGWAAADTGSAESGTRAVTPALSEHESASVARDQQQGEEEENAEEEEEEEEDAAEDDVDPAEPRLPVCPVADEDRGADSLLGLALMPPWDRPGRAGSGGPASGTAAGGGWTDQEAWEAAGLPRAGAARLCRGGLAGFIARVGELMRSPSDRTGARVKCAALRHCMWLCSPEAQEEEEEEEEEDAEEEAGDDGGPAAAAVRGAEAAEAACNALASSPLMACCAGVACTGPTPEVRGLAAATVAVAVRGATAIPRGGLSGGLMQTLRSAVEAASAGPSRLRRAATAALGEAIFYAATQLDEPAAEPTTAAHAHSRGADADVDADDGRGDGETKDLDEDGAVSAAAAGRPAEPLLPPWWAEAIAEALDWRGAAARSRQPRASARETAAVCCVIGARTASNVLVQGRAAARLLAESHEAVSGLVSVLLDPPPAVEEDERRRAAAAAATGLAVAIRVSDSAAVLACSSADGVRALLHACCRLAAWAGDEDDAAQASGDAAAAPSAGGGAPSRGLLALPHRLARAVAPSTDRTSSRASLWLGVAREARAAAVTLAAEVVAFATAAHRSGSPAALAAQTVIAGLWLEGAPLRSPDRPGTPTGPAVVELATPLLWAAGLRQRARGRRGRGSQPAASPASGVDGSDTLDATAVSLGPDFDAAAAAAGGDGSGQGAHGSLPASAAAGSDGGNASSASSAASLLSPTSAATSTPAPSVPQPPPPLWLRLAALRCLSRALDLAAALPAESAGPATAAVVRALSAVRAGSFLDSLARRSRLPAPPGHPAHAAADGRAATPAAAAGSGAGADADAGPGVAGADGGFASPLARALADAATQAGRSVTATLLLSAASAAHRVRESALAAAVSASDAARSAAASGASAAPLAASSPAFAAAAAAAAAAANDLGACASLIGSSAQLRAHASLGVGHVAAGALEAAAVAILACDAVGASGPACSPQVQLCMSVVDQAAHLLAIEDEERRASAAGAALGGLVRLLLAASGCGVKGSPALPATEGGLEAWPPAQLRGLVGIKWAEGAEGAPPLERDRAEAVAAAAALTTDTLTALWSTGAAGAGRPSQAGTSSVAAVIAALGPSMGALISRCPPAAAADVLRAGDSAGISVDTGGGGSGGQAGAWGAAAADGEAARLGAVRAPVAAAASVLELGSAASRALAQIARRSAESDSAPAPDAARACRAALLVLGKQRGFCAAAVALLVQPVPAAATLALAAAAALGEAMAAAASADDADAAYEFATGRRAVQGGDAGSDAGTLAWLVDRLCADEAAVSRAVAATAVAAAAWSAEARLRRAGRSQRRRAAGGWGAEEAPMRVGAAPAASASWPSVGVTRLCCGPGLPASFSGGQAPSPEGATAAGDGQGPPSEATLLVAHCAAVLGALARCQAPARTEGPLVSVADAEEDAVAGDPVALAVGSMPMLLGLAERAGTAACAPLAVLAAGAAEACAAFACAAESAPALLRHWTVLASTQASALCGAPRHFLDAVVTWGAAGGCDGLDGWPWGGEAAARAARATAADLVGASPVAACASAAVAVVTHASDKHRRTDMARAAAAAVRCLRTALATTKHQSQETGRQAFGDGLRPAALRRVLEAAAAVRDADAALVRELTNASSML